MASNQNSKSTTEAPAQDLDIFEKEEMFALRPEAGAINVRREQLMIAVKKPGKTSFIRVHPGKDYRKDVMLMEDKLHGETYLVTANMQLGIGQHAQPFRLYVYITREKNIALWPIRLPGADGKKNSYWESAMGAASTAMREWLRIEADISAGSYVSYSPENQSLFPEPQWPEYTMTDILRKAFSGKVIDSADHVLLKQLRGAA